ncbi:MAG: hypothetical protein ACRD8U_04530 [Pyrinomonadaceae bacterium]
MSPRWRPLPSNQFAADRAVQPAAFLIFGGKAEQVGSTRSASAVKVKGLLGNALSRRPLRGFIRLRGRED